MLQSQTTAPNKVAEKKLAPMIDDEAMIDSDDAWTVIKAYF